MSATICSAWKKFKELRGLLDEKQGSSLKTTREDQFCCTAAKRGNLLLRMRRGCVGRVSYHQNDVWGETG